MAKSEKKGVPAAAINRGNSGKPLPLPIGVGKAIPTPENIPHPHRKTSVPSKLLETHDQPQVGVTQ